MSNFAFERRTFGHDAFKERGGAGPSRGGGGRSRMAAGFTMIEIAISLAVIGFALVAIIGILPLGMSVQRENREETEINQDATVLLDAIRNGAQGLDDLVNYVVAITNYQTLYLDRGGKQQPMIYGYTQTGSTVNGQPASSAYPLISGFRIVGLLSTPKYYDVFTPATKGNLPEHLGFYSNHVVAVIRALSGQASDKFPQNNGAVRDMAFAYRLIPELVPYAYGTWVSNTETNSNAWNQDWTNYTAYLNSANANDWLWRSNYWRYARNLQVDLNDVRLLFRWPALPNGGLGGGRQVFRNTTTGPLQAVVERGFQNELPTQLTPYTLFFVQPKTFVKTP